MRPSLSAAMLFFAGCAVAHGNLGETLPQVEARYGPAQETRKDAATGVITNLYIHDGLGISVKFLGSKSQSETYLKGHKAGFSDAEIAALLKANAMGSDWQSVYKTAEKERWELKSRDATAVYSSTARTFIFSTKEFIRSGSAIRVIDTDP